MKKAYWFALPLAVFLLIGVFWQQSKDDNQSATQNAPKNMVQHGVDFSDQKAVEVIDYEGNYLLASKLRVGEPHPKHADGPGCELKHWHADNSVTAVNNGNVLSDPMPGGCGFGSLDERPVMNYFPHDLLAD